MPKIIERVSPSGGLFGGTLRQRLQPSTDWHRVTVRGCLPPSAPLDSVAEIQERNDARRARLAPLVRPKVLPVKYVGDVLPFNVPVDRTDGRILFKPGCFDGALREASAGWHHVPACFGHRRHFEFASTADATLRLWSDREALHFSVMPRDVPYGRFVVQHAQSNALRGVSAGYTPVESEERTDWDGTAMTVIKRAKLNEISFVVNPAFGEHTGFGSLTFMSPTELLGLTLRK